MARHEDMASQDEAQEVQVWCSRYSAPTDYTDSVPLSGVFIIRRMFLIISGHLLITTPRNSELQAEPN